MEKPYPKLPEECGFDLAYQESFRLAAAKLADMRDLEAFCRRTGAELTGGRTLTLDYLGQQVSIRLPGAEITPGEPGIRDRLIILHYLVTAGGAPLSGRLITYQELPEGIAYFPTFAKRAIKPLLDNFAAEPERLFATAQRLGAARAGEGDVSFRLSALPHVPLTVVLWRGDGEFPPQGSILFDGSVTDYLPTEDITVLCELMAWKLVRMSRQGG